MNNSEVAKLATKALLYEVSISPKAGLVSRLSNGSHKDMDFYTFIDSALSLDNYFSECFIYGQENDFYSPSFFKNLRDLGKKAEKDMYQATNGVNTHKGTIFSMGILISVLAGYLKEVDEIDLEIKEEDVEMKFTRSSGAGWQHVNKTDSAVQLKHLPTWIIVFCQDWRSQHKNREKARAILRSKLYAYEEEKREKELWEARLAQIGSWDRSEKIRTYNFPQDRVTDHRIWQNFSWIPQIMMWKLWHIIEALAIADRQAKLEAAWKWQI